MTAAPARDGSVPDVGGLPLLEVNNVDLSYGPLQVLFDVSLAVDEGSQVALLGTNGAGKSTLLRVVSGLLRPQRGEVLFRGRDITRMPAYERVALGLTLVEGGRATFPTLTVGENLRLGSYGDWKDRERIDARLDDVLELFPHLRPRLEQPAGTLSGGEQQMMAIGRALMADPQLLMIDELSLGLAPVVMQEIVRVVEELRARGTTILLVEQSLNIALSIASTAYFMEKGEVRFSGPSGDLLDRGDLVRSVFFGDRDEVPVTGATPAPPRPRRRRPVVADRNPGRGGRS
jgi:ABC-type branched-subunit amino acid transport system ATPase component